MGALLALPITFFAELFTSQSPAFHIWLKWIFSYVYICIYKKLAGRRFDLYDEKSLDQPDKLGFVTPKLEFELESPKPEFHLQHSADEVFCYGVNSKSECLIARVARGCHQEAEAWIYLKLSNGKVYHLTQTLNYQQSSGDKSVFSCGGLQMHYISPMRRWRIFYSGLLRESDEKDDGEERMVFVKFAFMWRASSDVFDFTSDIPAINLANALSETKWEGMIPPLKKLYDMCDFYSQAGVIMGTVSVGQEPSEHEMYLFGEKMRFFGETSHMKGSDFVHVLGNIPKNGCFIHLGHTSVPNVVKNLYFGFVVQPDAVIKPITEAYIYVKEPIDAHLRKNDLTAIFHAHETYELNGEFIGQESHFTSNKGWDGSLTFSNVDMQLNVHKGSGVILRGKIIEVSERCETEKPTPKFPKEVPLVVDFNEEISTFSEITGGKGSSLGTLTQLSKVLQIYVVPKGIVVTTRAYKEFTNPTIKKEIKKLESIAYGNSEGDVKETCKNLCDIVEKSKFPESVNKEIKARLLKLFAGKIHSAKFAVRSSATGEDTEQMSAAGQMDTFLGVSGLTEIINAVKKCWASQFGYIAVQYKRRYGQLLNSPMAVVIQEMVPCDIAGVLFTCDPVTGNPSVMSITANYGLGESVVSGSEEPDTIELQRDIEDKLSVKSTMVGAKSQRIVISEEQGTVVENISEDKRNECCISNDVALRLGNLAVKIEKHYKSHRDIEWGVWNNNVYILQSRPVTSGTGETDYEIMHEFDGPLRCENDYNSVCNVGEVLPGATSPLGLEIFFKLATITFQSEDFAKVQGFDVFRYFPAGMTMFYNHAMFSLVELVRFGHEETSSIIADGMMIAFLGRVLDDPDLFEMKKERYSRQKKSAVQNARLMYSFVSNLFFAGRRLKRAKANYQGYRIPVEKYKTSKELYNELVVRSSDLSEAFLSHMFCSQASSLWNMLAFAVLGKAKGGYDEEVYRDFALLLATCSDVESADVPSAIQSLAFHVVKDMSPEQFKNMSVEEGQNWLQTTPTTAGKKFRDFLVKHGHRCLKEFDVHSIPWGTDSKPLVKLVQNLVGNVSKDSVEKKVEDSDAMSKLTVQLSYKSKLLLKFLLPRSRKAVQNRESSKSLLIKGIDSWRKGYHQLSKLMVSEGRLPESDLLFFITIDEIGELLNTRSPKILAKAVHRQRVFPELDSYIFPEMMIGQPQPANMDKSSININEDNFMMKGIPVSQGIAKGFVRVAITIEEAALLKPKEILLTYSTDIGWSPYFPMLAGVVTELGGLISHGAVVSREYGLPCIAGLHGATRNFQTGDYVLLDGNRGILQKLPLPSEKS